jgi:hypothetical protein
MASYTPSPALTSLALWHHLFLFFKLIAIDLDIASPVRTPPHHPMHGNARNHSHAKSPRDQTEHNYIGSYTEPSPERDAGCDGKDKNRCLVFILFLASVCERGKGTAEENTCS